MIVTERLILRPWRPQDLEPFAKMNGDPRVREFFPSTLSFEESNREADRHCRFIEEHGWGFWAVSLPGAADFIGAIGLKHADLTTSFTPAVEIGWRLAFDYWGKGYATEAATAALKYGFETLRLPKIISYTPHQNIRSQAVMKKIGMRHAPEHDFDHPRLSEGHPLKRHALYLISREEQKRLANPNTSL